MPAKKTTLLNAVFAQLFFTFLFLTCTTPLMSQDADKPAKKNDALTTTNFFNYTKESLARQHGSMLGVQEDELTYYSGILNHIKNSDSATISKLPLPDKFLVLGVRSRSSISEIWAMDGKKIAEFILANNLDYNTYIKDLTIGDEILVSSTSTKTLKIFKADLLYKQQIIEEKTVIALLNNDVYYMPVKEFRTLYFKTIVAPAIKASGQSEDTYVAAMVNQLPTGLKSTPIWNAGKSYEYYSPGVLKSVAPYTNGKMNGIVTVYNLNGTTIKLTVEYANGEKIAGTNKYYDENGKLLPSLFNEK
ncbi:MAG: hypothetical protein V4604_15970 [Bacteroidota bacterium]